MVGVRRFDEVETLTQAMKVFWAKGYEATSIDDLVRATGVKRGSLYLAYGSKEGIFLKAFDRYCQEFEDHLLEMFDPSDPIAAISHIFGILANGAPLELPRGCLITQSAAELGGRDGPLGEAVRARLEASRLALAQGLSEAVDVGRAPSGLNPDRMSIYLLGIVRGLPLIARSVGTDAAQDFADAAVDQLRPAFCVPPDDL